MPRVLEDPDILEEHIALSPEGNELDRLLRALPSSQRQRSRLLALLRRLVTRVPRLRPCRQAYCVPGALRFEAPLDILAREHPDVHLRVMSGIG
jgi:hypothetical protein